jgi:DNA-binding transcriptional regulator YhcF (GntR family)
MNSSRLIKKYQEEYIKDNGRLFTIQQMAEFLNVSYAVTRNAYKRLKVNPVPASCKAVKRDRPSIEEYKQVFA